MRLRKYSFLAVGCALTTAAVWLMAEPAGSSPVESLRYVEVSAVSDAVEQLYGGRACMGHDMRSLAPAKFAGPAVTVLLKREEHKDGTAAVQGMMDAIDDAPAGSVYVMVLENGLDYAAVGGLMSSAMKARGLVGAVVDGSIRDVPQIRKLQFPVFSRGVAPATTINHFRLAGVNVPVTCDGVRVNPGDIVVGDEDGVAVVPRAHAAEVLKKAQDLDFTEHSMYPFIEKYRSLKAAVEKFGRL